MCLFYFLIHNCIATQGAVWLHSCKWRLSSHCMKKKKNINVHLSLSTSISESRVSVEVFYLTLQEILDTVWLLLYENPQHCCIFCWSFIFWHSQLKGNTSSWLSVFVICVDRFRFGLFSVVQWGGHFIVWLRQCCLSG